MPSKLTRELQIALLAVQKAAAVTRTVLRSSLGAGETCKPDRTCVSLADFAAQAILVAAIHGNFPHDVIVGEEDTAILRREPELCARVWDLVRETKLDEALEEPMHGPRSQEEMLQAIDRGGHAYSSPRGRVWMIDPIDGTKGFLSGGQYTVCATLMIDGREEMAVFACPHVNLERGVICEETADANGKGILISCERGMGVQLRTLSTGILETPIEVARRSPVQMSCLRFAENKKTESLQFLDRHQVAEALGAAWSPAHIYSTQLRYVALALGTTDVVLRMPGPMDKPGHIWDHTGGVMIFTEVGGKVSDLNGRELDFTSGRDLKGNFGLVAAAEGTHERVLESVQKVMESHPEYMTVARGTEKTS